MKLRSAEGIRAPCRELEKKMYAYKYNKSRRVVQKALGTHNWQGSGALTPGIC